MDLQVEILKRLANHKKTNYGVLLEDRTLCQNDEDIGELVGAIHKANAAKFLSLEVRDDEDNGEVVLVEITSWGEKYLKEIKRKEKNVKN